MIRVTVTNEFTFERFEDVTLEMWKVILSGADDALVRRVRNWLYRTFPPNFNDIDTMATERLAVLDYQNDMALRKRGTSTADLTERAAHWHATTAFLEGA